jgi:hypothetical protein
MKQVDTFDRTIMGTYLPALKLESVREKMDQEHKPVKLTIRLSGQSIK